MKRISSCPHVGPEQLSDGAKGDTRRKKGCLFQSQIKKTEEKTDYREVKSERGKQITSSKIGDKGQLSQGGEEAFCCSMHSEMMWKCW